ncbi:F-box/WD repeat-containing protein pof1 [Cinnamomum micranthum f. kanehirae]|uniref:F-box protein n=1 Tax=Cinnamomum micranthum f. kanehirae TaxID=337451 RepID=A0A443NQJ8_9MAGN|nr:F-box/WD repeat-containing protein pof1 [Cinnamomum micranthum f. kanehirae]
MERLPPELSLKIFCLLDHQNLAIAQQVCRKWKELASDNNLWYNLFKERWGENHAAFYAHDSKMWKDVYEIQDRCDRFGLGLKIIREGNEYYLVHQGEIQRYLGTRRPRKGFNIKREFLGEDSLEEPCLGISNNMLFFIGDMEVAARDAKRNRIL